MLKSASISQAWVSLGNFIVLAYGLAFWSISGNSIKDFWSSLGRFYHPYYCWFDFGRWPCCWVWRLSHLLRWFRLKIFNIGLGNIWLMISSFKLFSTNLLMFRSINLLDQHVWTKLHVTCKQKFSSILPRSPLPYLTYLHPPSPPYISKI